MKILSYTHAYVGSGHNAGAETTLHDVMRHLKANGNEVSALLSKPCKDGSGSYVVDGIRVQAHSSKQDPFLYIPASDLILSHLECASRAYLIAKTHGKPCVQLVHSNVDWAVTLGRKYADILVYNTEWIKGYYEDQGVSVPSVVLHPIVEPKRYSVPTTREYITLINLSNGKEPFYDKGYRTFYELAKRFPNEKFLGVEGAYGEQHIEDAPNVTFLKHTDNILEVYRRSKIMLMPSERETYGRVSVEAACSGIPTIASDTLGLREADCSYDYLPYMAFDQWEDSLKLMLDDYDFAASEAREAAWRQWQRSKEEIPLFVKEMERLGGGSNQRR